ncbi:hypothetical protein D3C72_1213960 [compost metagenome]
MQRRGQLLRILQRLRSQGVGHLFTLGPHARRQPPDDRVKEQQRLGHALQQVDQVIPAPHVGQFMRQQRFEQGDGHAAQQGGRQQDDGAPEAYGDGAGQARMQLQRRQPVQAHALRQRIEARLPDGRGGYGLAAQLADPGQAQAQAQAHQANAGAPGQHQGRHPRLQRGAPGGRRGHRQLGQ